ncbi:hypothetical protein EFQ32_05370 [Limosilactobacillus fermentum]|nr:hypothetical protein [Limosilactobacillus fermentum]MCT3442369.1 hypothetical protein [Limosilactobacillus fermentum]
MSYFDSRVGECPVWQVVLIMVVKVGIKVDITAFTEVQKSVSLALRVELTSMLLNFDCFD